MKRKCLNHLNLHDCLSLRYTVLSFSFHFFFLLSSSKIYHAFSFRLECFQCHSQKTYTSFTYKFLKLFSCQGTMREMNRLFVCLIIFSRMNLLTNFTVVNMTLTYMRRNRPIRTPFFKKN